MPYTTQVNNACMCGCGIDWVRKDAHDRACKFCGEAFKPDYNSQFYCGISCARKQYWKDNSDSKILKNLRNRNTPCGCGCGKTWKPIHPRQCAAGCGEFVPKFNDQFYCSLPCRRKFLAEQKFQERKRNREFGGKVQPLKLELMVIASRYPDYNPARPHEKMEEIARLHPERFGKFIGYPWQVEE